VPVVIVEMWQGRNEEQKAKLIKGVTKAFEDISVPADQLHIIIHDVPKCNWGPAGNLHLKQIHDAFEPTSVVSARAPFLFSPKTLKGSVGLRFDIVSCKTQLQEL